MELTHVFTNTLDAYRSGRYTIISNMGGTRSGKTYATLQLLYFILIGKSENLLISVVSRTIPHLKKGVLRDWEKILESVGYSGLVNENKTDHVFTFRNNNRIEFFSADTLGKLHGAARDILFVNECNFIEENKIQQLFVRTRGVKFIDYNPAGSFWIDNYRDRPDFIELHSTYKDNDFLTREQIAEIESMRKNRRWWSCYGEGKEYMREGLVFPNVTYEDGHVFTHPVYGVDFGMYDPTVIVRVEIEDNDIWCECLLYRKNMDISELKKELSRHVRREKIICDSAEPQIIKELQSSGFNAMPCHKGKNSVFEGCQLMNMYDIHCVVNGHDDPMKMEFQNYAYQMDRNENFTDIPEDRNNHTMDALRYVVDHLRGKKSGDYRFSIV